MPDKDKKKPKNKIGSSNSTNTGIIKGGPMVKYGTSPDDVSKNSK